MDILLLDGASGTLMENWGLKMHPELWAAISLLPENHHFISKYYQAYLDAGATVLTTPTYQATFAGFDGILTAQQVRKQFQFVVDNARELAVRHNKASPAKVAASLGPYGASLLGGQEFTGDYGAASVDEIYEFHAARFQAFVESDPDIVLFETIANRKECEAIARLLAEQQALKIPVWVAFSIKWGHDGDNVALADGTPLQQIAQLDWPSTVEVFGANCFPPQYAASVIQDLQAFKKPLIIYPNSGEVYNGTTKEWAPAPLSLQTQLTVDVVKQWYNNGVRVFGGCCRTDPEYIEHLAQALDSLHSALGAAEGSAA